MSQKQIRDSTTTVCSGTNQRLSTKVRDSSRPGLEPFEYFGSIKEIITEEQESQLGKVDEPRFGTYDEMLQLQQYPVDNSYLLDGYRINYFKFCDCFKSVCQWHNETQNIWTHQVGAVVFVALIFYFGFFYNESERFYENMVTILIPKYSTYVSFLTTSRSFCGQRSMY